MNLKSKLVQRAFRIAILLIGFYSLISATACGLQRRLIYYPSKCSPELAEIMASRAGFIPWKNSQDEIIGWKLPATGSPTASVLVVHGNAGCAIDRGYFARPIHESGSVDVFVLEYPGYGARTGSPGAKSFLAAADDAFSSINPDLPIYIVSESLGTGVAAHLAQTQGEKISGLAMFVPYDNFTRLAQSKMPFLPVFLILRDRYNPEAWLKDYDGPIQFVLAENDEVIPIRFGMHLHDSYKGPKKLQLVKGAGHNSVSAQSPEWWKEIFAFWREKEQRP